MFHSIFRFREKIAWYFFKHHLTYTIITNYLKNMLNGIIFDSII